MRYIITETQRSWLLRRLSEIEDHVNEALRFVDPHDYIFHDYVDEIAWQVADQFSDLGESELEMVMEYVREHYWKKIETRYLKSKD